MSIINIIINNININKIDNDGNTLLHMLILYKKTDDIIELLNHNPNIIYKNKQNLTAICIARKIDDPIIYNILINYCNKNNINYKLISPSNSLNDITTYSSSNESDYLTLSSSITSSSSRNSSSSNLNSFDDIDSLDEYDDLEDLFDD